MGAKAYMVGFRRSITIFVLSIFIPSVCYAGTCESAFDAIRIGGDTPWSKVMSMCLDENERDLLVGRKALIEQDFDQVVEALQNYKGSSRKEYLDLKAAYLLSKAIYSGSLEKEDWEEVVNSFNSLVEEFPGYFGGYAGLASVSVFFKNLDKAKKYAQESLRRQENSVGYRTLAVVYFYEKDYKQLLKNGNMAVGLDRSRLADIQLVSAICYGYLVEGDIKRADAFLTELLNRKPDAKETPVIQYIIEKLDEYK